MRVTDSAHTRTKADLRHAERLTVPLWHWLLPLAGAVLLSAQIQYAYPALPSWAPYALLVPVTVAAILTLGRVRVAVEGGDEPQLWVGEAHLPLRYVAAVDVVPNAGKRKALGPELDPAAFCVHKPWVRTMVRVHLDDPDDPAPYWLFSTRHPAKLAALLTGDAAPRSAVDSEGSPESPDTDALD
ncbi:DUF3093 domain-containing protein [Saccharomonospora xinjiangensis]|uniref:DUF3093 domain-containing protein n=1 Tax=Saccharomonospora xinjiangensis TaxID=75294 RepID=UPI00106F9407|nr:DUF3093 domain-containing protein [Saccharomonospora xinjiangensis]QBQ61064.1 hypothetical protein EYD13_13560 [Saccharomonospora xinjiangensis]